MAELSSLHGFRGQTAEMQGSREPVEGRMSNEEVGRLLCAFGNSEAKAITLILLRNGSTFSSGALTRELLVSQGKTKVWNINKNTIWSYCSKSFSPIGLAEVGHVPDSYHITEYGREFGVPLAGLLLEFSERYNIPLLNLWGSSASRSPKRISTAPLSTYEIFLEVAKSNFSSMRETDVENAIRKKSKINLGAHLKRLSELGIIQYKSIKADGPFADYILRDNISEDNIPTYRTEKKLTKLVFDIFREHEGQYLGIEDVYNLFPEEEKKVQKKEGLLRRIPNVISFLMQKEFLQAKDFHHGKYSEITLNEKQREILTELLDIIDKYKNHDQETIEKGRRFAEEIANNPERLSNLLRRARESSSYANKSSESETKKQIRDIVLGNPGITNGELQLILQTTGKSLSRVTISRLTHSMETGGSLKMIKRGKKNIFFPPIF